MIYDPEIYTRLIELKGKRKVIFGILKSIEKISESKYKILIRNLENKSLKKN
ncbi:MULTISPECIES: hypothetical protein [unclassified Thermosipho (in: thermotogales)]|uniref:hypothetical protein n=1 Tax=unclassified Thermosipho (in: thermotogales) TaxID=2676525 RepID=UPI001E5EE0E0|nr:MULTISPECIES: hypothetical protein [unclassified Thermosipho (in: thermotogales)]